MIRISRMSDYAVVILFTLASFTKETPVSVAQLSKKTGISPATVAKLAQKLSNASLIKARRGARGGYYSPILIHQLSVAQIVEAIDGPIALTACVDESHKQCESSNICPMHGGWRVVNKLVYDALSSITLAHIQDNIMSIYSTKQTVGTQ